MALLLTFLTSHPRALPINLRAVYALSTGRVQQQKFIVPEALSLSEMERGL